jgi:hypothetical protein
MTASNYTGMFPLTAAEMDQVSGGVDIGGAIGGAIVAGLNWIINAVYPPGTLEVGPSTITPVPPPK